MKKILIATTNKAKFDEICYFLNDTRFKFLSLEAVNIKSEPEENHPTFRTNAQFKAKYYCRLSGLPTISDDGGLEIDCLNGAPGVMSKRWINGKVTSDRELVDFTLNKLKGINGNKRSARLTTVIALALPNGKIYSYTGSVKGIIAETPYKILTPGFPYRSLLYLPEIHKYYHSREMNIREMEKYNHRGKVLAKMKKILYFLENNL